jgi:acetyl-CoA carboxylase carboxyl transferase subunit beta
VDDIDGRFKFYDYSDSRKKMSSRTDSKDSLIIGYGMLTDMPVAIAVSDFRFMGGSMGSVFGEKMKMIVDYAINRRLPLISVSSTGGARMHEGTVALYQMPKTILSVLKLKDAGLPYISILGHPTTGGALASYVVQGDFMIAEKKANIAFAGDRVVKLTSEGRQLDPNITTSNFMLGRKALIKSNRGAQLKSAISGLLNCSQYKDLRKQWIHDIHEIQKILRSPEGATLLDTDLPQLIRKFSIVLKKGEYSISALYQ